MAASAAQYSFFNHQLLLKTPCAPLQQRRLYLTHRDHRDALRRSFLYVHIFGPISSVLFGLSADALSTIAFCVDCLVHLSLEGTSVVKTDSEGWTVFLGRRIVLPFLGVSSPDCNQNRTGLVTAGRQRMRMVAGSEGATDGSTPDCPHCTFTTAIMCYHAPITRL